MPRSSPRRGAPGRPCPSSDQSARRARGWPCQRSAIRLSTRPSGEGWRVAPPCSRSSKPSRGLGMRFAGARSTPAACPSLTRTISMCRNCQGGRQSRVWCRDSYVGCSRRQFISPGSPDRSNACSPTCQRPFTAELPLARRAISC
jgi:hypothetical protein